MQYLKACLIVVITGGSLSTPFLQIIQWIDWFTRFSDFKMNPPIATIHDAYFCNALPSTNMLPFFNKIARVISISCQKLIVMFYDDQISIPTQPIACISDNTASRCMNFFAFFSSNIYTLLALLWNKISGYSTVYRP